VTQLTRHLSTVHSGAIHGVAAGRRHPSPRQTSSRAAPGAPKIDAPKDLTDSRKGAILMR
jgi:hypothetical protein